MDTFFDDGFNVDMIRWQRKTTMTVFICAQYWKTFFTALEWRNLRYYFERAVQWFNIEL